MPAYLVLLRGVNVGGTRRVPMAELRALLLDIGCSSATTVLNSGNAVVSAARTTPSALARKVAAAMDQRFGFRVPVIVKSRADLAAIVRANPFAGSVADHSRLLVAFAQDDEALDSLAALANLESGKDEFSLQTCAAYLYCPGGLIKSKAAAALLGKMSKMVTTRNWTTVLKLHALVQDGIAPRSSVALGVANRCLARYTRLTDPRGTDGA